MSEDDPRARLESLGRTSAELLHDLAADLQVLRGWARLVSEGVRTGRATPPDAAALEDEADRVGRLVADAVDWLADPHPRTTFSPADRLNAVVERVDRREGVVPVELAVSAPEGLHVAGPATFFDRIAANLVRNAVRHADRRVRVSLDAEPRAGGEGVRLRVEDDGSGIEPELRGSLFTPFARTDVAGGHGLGLSSTAWLAQQLAGTPPEARASSLGGACMEVWFPTRRVAAGIGDTPIPLEGLRAVLVDDEPAVRQVLVALLRRERMQVEGMDYAADLIDRLVAMRPDLVLLDRNLGHVSGLELWRALRARDPALARRTMLLSGAPQPGERHDQPPELRKPLDLGAFRRTVARVLAAAPEAPAPRATAGVLYAGTATRAYAAVFREVLRALDDARTEAAVASLQRWTVGVDGRSMPPTLLAELGEAAWMAREALRQGAGAVARRWVERGLGLLGENVDAA